MKSKIVKLLNLIRFRIIGTILLSITITVNAIEATAPNYRLYIYYSNISNGDNIIMAFNSRKTYC